MAALRDQWQADREQRQQAVQERRQVVQADLDRAKQQREASARCTSAMLKEFDAELRETVADMRAQNKHEVKATQKYVAELQEVTQKELGQLKQARIEQEGHQKRRLSKYVDELEDCVSEYLSDVSETRQAAAVADQTARQQERTLLTDQWQKSRDGYAADAQDRKALRADLKQSVWGNGAGTATAATNGAQHSNGHALAPHLSAPADTATKLDALVEKAVYEYLQANFGGARLADIEASVGISRLQTVDALQALLKKGLILQKDRLYRLREEVTL